MSERVRSASSEPMKSTPRSSAVNIGAVFRSPAVETTDSAPEDRSLMTRSPLAVRKSTSDCAA